MTNLTWILVALTGLIIAYALSVMFFWHPHKDTPRENFAHYIHGLIRFYANSASLLVTLKAKSIPLFRFRRTDTNGDGCDLLLEIVDSPLAASHRGELLDEIRKHGYQATQPGTSARDDWPITVKIKIKDIWQVNAGNLAARLVHAALDVMGIDREARFSLSWNGPRSRERTLEARRRQKQGFDLGGIGLKK